MKLILFLLKCSKGVRYARSLMAVVILTSIISGAGSTVLLAIINTALTAQAHSTSSLVLSFIGICLALSLSRIVSQILLLRFSTGVLFNLRVQMCRRILAVPLRKLEEKGSHRLLATITDDIGTISGTVSSMPLFCTQIAIIVCSVIYLMWLSATVFLFIIGFIILGVAIYHVSVRKAMHYNRLAREEWDTLFKHFRGIVEGTKELKLHRGRRVEFLDQSLHHTSATLQGHQVAASTIYIYANYWSQILTFAIIGLLIFALPLLQGVSTHIMTGYTLVFFYMLGPLQSVLNTLPALSQANVAINKVEELGITLTAQSIETDATAPADRDLTWMKLDLVGVTHAYYQEREKKSFLLGPIDLTLYSGELIFVTGGNGSGKTTLVKLLTGLYIPETGEIRLNDRPITDEIRDHYRQHFSVVFSDFYLFDSLLGLASPELDDRARAYLAQLQIDHKVQIKEGVLSTAKLSQGQRKRLALLTAYLEDRPIYVFDEWAADQDPLFREVFYLQILAELKARGKTVIVITHDDRYYHVADRIIKLDCGKITSDGRSMDNQPDQLPYAQVETINRG